MFFFSSFFLIGNLDGKTPKGREFGGEKVEILGEMAKEKVMNDKLKAQVVDAFGRMPLYFIENRGQMDERVKYYGRAGGYGVYFTEEGMTFVITRRDYPPKLCKYNIPPLNFAIFVRNTL